MKSERRVRGARRPVWVSARRRRSRDPADRSGPPQTWEPLRPRNHKMKGGDVIVHTKWRWTRLIDLYSVQSCFGSSGICSRRNKALDHFHTTTDLNGRWRTGLLKLKVSKQTGGCRLNKGWNIKGTKTSCNFTAFTKTQNKNWNFPGTIVTIRITTPVSEDDSTRCPRRRVRIHRRKLAN